MTGKIGTQNQLDAPRRLTTISGCHRRGQADGPTDDENSLDLYKTFKIFCYCARRIEMTFTETRRCAYMGKGQGYIFRLNLKPRGFSFNGRCTGNRHVQEQNGATTTSALVRDIAVQCRRVMCTPKWPVYFAKSVSSRICFNSGWTDLYPNHRLKST